MLLEWSSGRRREDLLMEMPTHAEQVVTPTALREFERAIGRRSRGTPIAYIVGTREFFGLRFAVSPHVLIPRADTEILVEEVLECIGWLNPPVSYHDCCTGSGCVAIAVAATCTARGIEVSAGCSDIQQEAVAMARSNARSLLPTGVQLDAWCGPWLSGLKGTVDVVSANPPYLTDQEAREVLGQGWGEPESALAAGPDGLQAYRALIPDALDHLNCGGYLVLECGAGQSEAVCELCRTAGFSWTRVRRDLAGRDRVVTARRGPRREGS